MDPKLELTKSQLETILRLINDVNLIGDKGTSVNKSSSNDKQTKTKRITSLSKKRSYSAVNLKTAGLYGGGDDPSDHQLINESFRKSIASLVVDAKNETKSPGHRSSDGPTGQPAVKLKRNKSLIELKREKWNREQNELKDSESWYEKFDSFKKKPIDRSRSQPDLPLSVEDNLFHQSVSRLFSPVSNFDDESIALSYTAPQSSDKAHSPAINDRLAASPIAGALENEIRSRFIGQLNASDPRAQMVNRPAGQPTSFDPVRASSRSPNEPFNLLINQPRKSFHRYAHQYSNVNYLEKRRKQQEYQQILDAQMAHKRAAARLRSQQQMLEDRRFEEKLVNELRQLRNEYETDHKEELANGNGAWPPSRREEAGPKGDSRRRERKPATSELERLETKSKELVRLFRETGTQTDGGEAERTFAQTSVQASDQHLLLNKWQTTGTIGAAHSILQPVRSNRSALLRNSLPNSKPKWTKQSQRNEDSRTSILPKLTTTQKTNAVLVRKKWNS